MALLPSRFGGRFRSSAAPGKGSISNAHERQVWNLRRFEQRCSTDEDINVSIVVEIAKGSVVVPCPDGQTSLLGDWIVNVVPPLPEDVADYLVLLYPSPCDVEVHVPIRVKVNLTVAVSSRDAIVLGMPFSTLKKVNLPVPLYNSIDVLHSRMMSMYPSSLQSTSGNQAALVKFEPDFSPTKMSVAHILLEEMNVIGGSRKPPVHVQEIQMPVTLDV
eukprot:CAMPEP_0184748720 /NCGR_PEP_ID=MMETSP0315-20130426/22046_1 /TAXON_ID=101924 /ORGANISM="Rhodosorus marinus, Strain UTEX LB 2760" /LENGTH=216 /DNA_ID=CAMNT_0027224511 /DNA_START=373 /DNA_END=1022 /DNA_ORIENTATION=+